MSGNKFQIKRTGVSGRQPNTTNSSNSAYIDVGELALNFVDEILYSSDGNTVIELGANVTNQNITGTLTANGSVGSNGQVLVSNGSGIYWGESGGGATGGGDDEVFFQNDKAITTDYTIPVGKNALTTGPLDIDAGITVTISSGSRWVVL